MKLVIIKILYEFLLLIQMIVFTIPLHSPKALLLYVNQCLNIVTISKI